MKPITCRLAFACLCLLPPAAASAQVDLNINNQAFEQRGTSDPTADPRRALEERFLTGDTDLLLLQERQFFEARSRTDLTFTSNARLSDDNRVEDLYVRQEAALRASTRIDRTWDVYLEAGAVFTRFFDENDLNTNVPFARLGVSRLALDGVIGGSVTGNLIYDDEFDRQLIDQLVLTGFYLRPVPLPDNWLAVPRVVVNHTWADPDNFTFLNLTVGTDLVKPLAEDLAWVSRVDVYGSWYKDYFTEALGEDREDFGVRVGTELRWDVSDNAVLRGVLGFNTQDSSVDFLDYSEFTATAGLLLTVNF